MREERACQPRLDSDPDEPSRPAWFGLAIRAERYYERAGQWLG